MFDGISLPLIKECVSFAGKQKAVFEDDSIPELQYKGVTALCRILQEHQCAYLADEVGMGKTYQALGVISMLLSEKEDAQILIISPNEAVQHNWVTEINNFKEKNLLRDITFKTKEEHPVDLIKGFCQNQMEANVHIVRLTSFSTIAEHIARRGRQNRDSMFTAEEISEGLTDILNVDKDTILKGLSFQDSLYSSEAGRKCGEILKKYSPRFSLVVIDEAQNIRNENNATLFLDSWMGLKRFEKSGKNCEDKDRKYLLMSATPAHRGVESLRNQFLYFLDKSEIPTELDHAFLERYLIRRLRTYNGENKYEVRHVNPDNVLMNTDEKQNTKQRLFLALLQSRLAQLQEHGKNNATFKIGFLETFESYGATEESSEDSETGENNKEFENGGSQKENEKGSAPDKELLKQLTKSYFQCFGEKAAPHPKLDYMEEELRKLLDANVIGKDCTPEKALIFVRRLASVDELVFRLNKRYEGSILEHWGKEFKVSPELPLIQDEFQKIFKQMDQEGEREEEEDEIEDDEIEKIADEQGEEKKKSELLLWMSVKKTDKDVRFNSVSLFKKSMMRNKSRSFLFEENYYRTTHGSNEIRYKRLIEKIVDDAFVMEVSGCIRADEKRYITYSSGKRKNKNSDLLILCCYVALAKEGHAMAEVIKRFYRIKERVACQEPLIDGKLIKKLLLQTSLWNCLRVDKRAHAWFCEKDFDKRYIIQSWIEKYLKSSEAVLELLYCACMIKDTKNKPSLCRRIIDRLFETRVHINRIEQLIKNQSLIFNQLLDEKEIDYRYDPAFMNIQQWVMPAVGGNKGNGALIKRFNTPFYPDVIVCTDVLKEGINLHLFCNRIYHYGLAWTPGDLEQRIGRVDRFFSKTYRERIEKKDSHIEVYYPYMEKSIDEHQLRKVLQFKLSADPLMDSNGSNRKDIDVVLEELPSIDELAKYVPSQSERTNFPYSGEIYWKTEEN